MNKATVIRAFGTITNPPADNPVFPDITSGLIIDWNPEDLKGVYSDNESVTQWVGRGTYLAAARTLRSNIYTGWVPPKFNATGGGGKGSVKFSGPDLLCTATMPAGYDGPVVHTIVVVMENYTPHGTSDATPRVFGAGGMSTGSGQNNIRITADGNTLSTNVPVSSGSTQITRQRNNFVAVASFNGDNSVFGVSGSPIIQSAIQPSTFCGASLGSNRTNNTISAEGLAGEYLRVMVFDRAFSLSDVEAMIDSMEDQYSLAG